MYLSACNISFPGHVGWREAVFFFLFFFITGFSPFHSFSFFIDISGKIVINRTVDSRSSFFSLLFFLSEQTFFVKSYREAISVANQEGQEGERETRERGRRAKLATLVSPAPPISGRLPFPSANLCPLHVLAHAAASSSSPPDITVISFSFIYFPSS